MTDLQRAELAMVFYAFKENSSPCAVNGEEWRIKNCEVAIEQILDILSRWDAGDYGGVCRKDGVR